MLCDHHCQLQRATNNGLDYHMFAHHARETIKDEMLPAIGKDGHKFAY